MNQLRFLIVLSALIISTTALAQEHDHEHRAPKPLKQGNGKPVVLSSEDKTEWIVNSIADQLVIISDSHWHEGEYCHLVALLKTVVAARPTDVESFSNAGWLLWSMDRDLEAIALYEQGLQSNLTSAFMFDELGHYYFQRKKDYSKALKYYKSASEKKDVNMLTLHMLAHTYEKLNQFDGAMKVWERCASNPTDGAAKTNLARLKVKMNQKGARTI